MHFFSYNGKSNQDLKTLRFSKFRSAKASSLNPASFPPSERAAFFHACRVHLQVCQWRTLAVDGLLPTDWGWVFQKSILVPIKTDLPPAPEELVKILCCKCHSSSKGYCTSFSCSCKKNGLECISACSHCHGRDCGNKVICDDSEDEFCVDILM